MFYEFINFLEDNKAVFDIGAYSAGKLADATLRQIANAYKYRRGNFDRDYCKLQLKTLNKCLPSDLTKDNSKRFEEFFAEYSKEHSVILDEEGLKAFLKTIQITECDDIIEEFRKKLIFQLSNMQELYNHLTLTILFELQDFLDREWKKGEKEYDDVLSAIHTQLTYFCQRDYYQGITSLQPGIYRYIMSQLGQNDCKRDIIELAYKLTVIMDYFKDKEELIPLARRIEELIQNDEPSYMYYRMRIGCIYSILQADRTNPVIQDEVEAKYNGIYEEMKKWGDTHTARDEVYILNGLYESNYGALLLNRHALLKERAIENSLGLEAADACLNDALAHHLKGLEYKEKALTYYKNNPGVAKDDEYKDAELKYYKSVSNVGTCYFKMGKYREALDYHEIALQGRMNMAMDTEMIQTKKYMLGCYLNIKDELSDEEKARCKKFLDDCEEYYKKNKDVTEEEKIVILRGKFGL